MMKNKTNMIIKLLIMLVKGYNKKYLLVVFYTNKGCSPISMKIINFSKFSFFQPALMHISIIFVLSRVGSLLFCIFCLGYRVFEEIKKMT